ncbi:hypothetical protein [Dyella sp.]|uniref:hypothetical protein n=1 Tax=Dyella sp. TaxID=1869338 RepID=UPI003F801610
MFSTHEVIDALKEASFDQEPIEGLTHCQLLEGRAKELGFESYHHLRTLLMSVPEELFEHFSLALMRKICSRRMPTLDCAYYEFIVLPDRGIGFYSHFIGWDRLAEEVRVPRPLVGRPTASGLRGVADHPIYVLESTKEVSAWQASWRTTALMPEALARETFSRSFNKEHLVDANPPLHLIRRPGKYVSNIARDL